jgi:hypothetical protein
MKLSLGTASSILLLVAAAAASPITSGCAAEDATDGSSDDLTQSYTFDVKMPAGSPLTASITTQGTACPRGDNLFAALAADGSTLKLELDAYDATLARGQASKALGCSIQVALKGAGQTSVAVTSLGYSGYTTLDKSGMLERHTVSYSFAGGPAAASDNRLDVSGPFSNTYRYQSDIADGRRAWTPCSATNTLSADLNMTLSNNAQKTGTAALDPDAHKVRHAIVFGLAWKTCVAPTDAGAPIDTRDAGGSTDTRDSGSVELPPDLMDAGLIDIRGDGGFSFPPNGGLNGSSSGGR